MDKRIWIAMAGAFALALLLTLASNVMESQRRRAVFHWTDIPEDNGQRF